MTVDPIAAPGADLTHDFLQPGVHYLDRLAAVAADDVMVVHARRAGDVRVLARRKVDALEGATCREQIERPEDGRAADGDAAVTGVGEQLCRGEVTAASRDEIRKNTAWRGVADGPGGGHADNDTEYQEESKTPAQQAHGESFGVAWAA